MKIYTLIGICLCFSACNKTIYNVENCQFTQKFYKTYKFSCDVPYDKTASFSDDDLLQIANIKAQNSGAQFTKQQNENWYLIKFVNAKYTNNGKLNANGEILIGDISLLKKYKNAKK